MATRFFVRFLVGIVVLQASIGVFAGHIPFVHPTIVCVMRQPESVIVTNITVYKEKRRPSVDLVNLLWCISSVGNFDVQRKLSTWKHCEEMGIIWLTTTFCNGGDGGAFLKNFGEYNREANVIGGGRAIILSGQPDSLPEMSKFSTSRGIIPT
jgi:hypothetical protein